MEPQRVWSVRRSRREDAGKRVAFVSARVNLQSVTLSLVQPGHDDDVLAGHDSVKARLEGWAHFQPRVGTALRALFGCLHKCLEAGTDDANRAEGIICLTCVHEASSVFAAS